MEIQDILQHFLPKEFVEYFDLVDIKKKDNQLHICLDEKNVQPPEHSDKHLESKGFTSVIQLHDFPIRDQAVLLKIRKRKWRDKQTGKTYSRSWDLKQDGTNYTKEFALFLKKMYRYQTR